MGVFGLTLGGEAWVLLGCTLGVGIALCETNVG